MLIFVHEKPNENTVKNILIYLFREINILKTLTFIKSEGHMSKV